MLEALEVLRKQLAAFYSGTATGFIFHVPDVH